MLAIIYQIFFIGATFAVTTSTLQQINFIKTLDKEVFRTDLIPTLETNISYIEAQSLNKSQIKYSLVSDYFHVNEYSGQIYLKNYLPISLTNALSMYSLTITAFNSFGAVSIQNTISIQNANNISPEFISTQRVFKIEEDISYPSDLVYNNGSLVEIKVTNADPSNTRISLKCENTLNHPNACSIFSFNRIQSRSSNTVWIGTIRVLKKLNFLEKSVYQFYGLAKNDRFRFKRVTFEVRVLPNLNKAPILSTSSYLFSIYENNLPNTLIGELNIIKEYGLVLKSATTFTIVNNQQELLNAGISSNNITDVNFNLIRNYIQIKAGNQLIAINTIDRDSFEFSNLNSELNIWIKVYFSSSPFICNYYKIKILVLDINDNIPTFALISNNMNSNFYSQLQSEQTLTATLKEKETGLIVFDNLNIFSTPSKSLIAIDLDLDENSTFLIYLNDYKTNENERVSLKQINSLFKVLQPKNYIRSRIVVNLFNYKEIDFESLDTPVFIDPITGIATKFVKFLISAKEVYTSELYSSIRVPVVLTIEDINDNAPEFSQTTYFGSVKQIFTNATLQKIIQFKVTDRDSGKYGIPGLNCYLLGDQDNIFIVDSLEQSIYLKPCLSHCSAKSFKPIYYLTLICKDNYGINSNVGTTTVLISFQNAFISCFTVPNKNYYLLATGISGTDIPSLTIKASNLDPNRVLQFTILDIAMKQYFSVDQYGVFRIIAKELNYALSPQNDGKFTILIYISDSNGCSETVRVYLQISRIITQSQCPRISITSLCEFNINQTTFDSNRIRLCFYGKSPSAFNLKYRSNYMSNFYEQIYYSLLPNSPNYLHLNPFDGCVKLAPVFKLESNSKKYIQYSVGAFNPNYPDCISTNQRSCLITISNPKIEPMKCLNIITLIGNSTTHKLSIKSGSNSILFYNIIKEERLRFDGAYEFYSQNFITQINPTTGFIQIKTNQILKNYASILVMINVQDLNKDINTKSSSIQCFAEFRFTKQVLPRSPQFIGSIQREENICEDLPVGALVTRLIGFDLSLTNQSLCYSILANDYFQLKYNQEETSSDGSIILKKSLQNIMKYQSSINITASLYYCFQPTALAQQRIIFNILNLNQFAPRLNIQVATAQISLSKFGDYSTSSINIVDEDAYPYNYFACSIDDEDDFYIINDNNRKTIKIVYKNPEFQRRQIIPFVDIAVTCCDDSSYWGENVCFSVGKCTTKPLRIQFTDFSVPIYCINSQQVNFIPENTPIASKIGSVSCITNYTLKPISYSISQTTNYFAINKDNGEIYLQQSLMNMNSQTLPLSISCTNEMTSDNCVIEFSIMPMISPQPIWIFPNVQNFEQCIIVREPLDINSLVTTVRAELSIPDQNSIQYSFVDQGCLTDRVFEFYIKSTDSGQIYIGKKLNRSVNLFRELTLAASYSKNTNEPPIIVNQYLCLKILTLDNNKPSFPLTPDSSKWGYQVNLWQFTGDCFYDQIVQISNFDYINTLVYYYIIPSKLSTDNLYSYFKIEQNTGIICPLITSENLADIFVNSSASYIDTFTSNTCYNLMIYASDRLLTYHDLLFITYDSKNSSFTYMKVCTNKIKKNYKPPVFNGNNCEKTITLDSLTKFDVSCLNQFQLIYSLSDIYEFTIKPINNYLDSKLFYINKSTNCLALNINSETESIKNSLPGSHIIDVNIKDNSGGFDSTECRIYIIESCKQKIYLITDKVSEIIRANLQFYKDFVLDQAKTLISKKLDLISDGILSFPKSIQNQPNEATTIIEMSFYDYEQNRFLDEDEIIPNLLPILLTIKSKSLGIINITSSCPITLEEPKVTEFVGIAIWSFLLLALLLILPILFGYFICYAFKKFKYQNNRIIMRQKVIPIIQETSSSCKFSERESVRSKRNSSKRSSKKRNSPKLEFSRESSFNIPQQPRTKRGSSFNNSALYDDAIIEEPELNDEVVYRRSVQASEILNNMNNNKVKRNISQISKPIVIREQIGSNNASTRGSLSSKNNLNRTIHEDSMEYDTINSKSINGYKF